MNTRQIHYVLKVAEERSFSAAAKKLFVTQPSLSEFIRKVEQELGYDLFDRTVSPLRLTVAGEVYVETARKMLNLESEMGHRLRDIDESQFGRLSIGVSPYSGLVTSVLKRFYNEYPHYKVDIQDSVGTEERLRLLEQGDLDLCIQPLFEGISSKFATEEIMHDEMVLVLPADHPVNNVLPVRKVEGVDWPVIEVSALRYLRDVPFTLVDNSKRLRKQVNALFDQMEITPYLKVVCHQSEGCVSLANAGICATIVQSGHIKYREMASNVRCYQIHQEGQKRRIAAIYVQNRYLSKAAREFINILKTI